MTKLSIHRMVLSSMCCALAAAALPGSAVRAADFPTKPIRIVVGWLPGGGNDISARALTPKLTAALGQQVIVDNRPGHSGTIAADIVSKATPDGHTVLLVTIAHVINPIMMKDIPFDIFKDLSPLTRGVDSTNILVVHPTVPVKSVKDLISVGKAKPLNAGSSGVGGTGHLAVELFNLQTGTKITHVGYKGGGPAMIDLLAGNIHLIFATVATSISHMKSGKLRALAVSTAKRSLLVPELPTVAEAGVPGFEANNWNGFLVPAQTPQSVVNRLNKELASALLSPDTKDFLFKQGLDAAPGTPEEFASYMRSESAKWTKVIRAAGIEPS
jgi:tripartite-type tricarboxylate transporter receptor subunit TctC